MPAASSKAELLELAAERSSLKPAKSWNPGGRPRSCTGGWTLRCDAGRLLRGSGRCNVFDATGLLTVPTTAAEMTVRRNEGTCVDEAFVADTPGYGTGCSALWCAGGGATGLGAA
jgi:hypothetical protein